MKTKEFNKEVRGLSLSEAKIRMRELSEELMKLRFRNAAGQLESAHRLKEVRRSRARVATIIAQKTVEGRA